MSMVVQHNLTAMNSNRMLGVTTSSQAKSTEKLSSGYKINRAADDAAGLAISEKMRKQIRGLTQASTNAQDGISAVQTAEGALAEVQDMLQRMNELAVKSANGTNSASDRDSIQAEVDQLITEIDRVSETTKFNETYLLKGDKNADKDVKFAYKPIQTTSADLYYAKEDGTIGTLKKGSAETEIDANKTYYKDSTIATGGEIKDGSDISDTSAVRVINADSIFKKDAATGEYTAVDKNTVAVATDFAKYYTAGAPTGSKYVDSDMTAFADSDAFDAKLADAVQYDGSDTIHDTDGNAISKGDTIDTDEQYYVAKGNAGLNEANKVNTADYLTGSNNIQFIDKDKNEIASNGLDKYIDNNGKLKAGSGLMVRTGEGVTDYREATQSDVDAMVSSTEKFKVGALKLTLHVGADATTNNQITADIKSMSAETLGVKGLKVNGEDDSNALNAIETIKAALEKVSNQRSDLGAVQNRLEHTIKNLDNVVENTTSAESQIRDTDMAKTMVEYSKNNILAQAGQSMLAQANQSNQGVLSLLG